jgi:hypothetical protein
MGKPLYDGWLKHICAELYVIFSRTKTGVQKAFLLAYYYWSYHASGRWQIATLRLAFIFLHHLGITRLSEETISIFYVIYRNYSMVSLLIRCCIFTMKLLSVHIMPTISSYLLIIGPDPRYATIVTRRDPTLVGSYSI